MLVDCFYKFFFLLLNRDAAVCEKNELLSQLQLLEKTNIEIREDFDNQISNLNNKFNESQALLEKEIMSKADKEKNIVNLREKTVQVRVDFYFSVLSL